MSPALARQESTLPALNWLDRAIVPIAPSWAAKRLQARYALQLAQQYRAATSTRLNADWALGHTVGTPPVYELTRLRQMSRDLNRNDPVASGATDTITFNIVGQGLGPQSRIRADRLGIPDNRAKQLQQQAEDAWDLWGRHADAGNRMTIDELQFLAIRKVVEDGEILAIPVMSDEPWRPFSRCLEMIESERLDSFSAAAPHGIKVGPRGEPQTYYIRQVDWRTGMLTGERIPIEARDLKGRPKIIHVFPSRRVGQLRGVPWFAPVISYFRDLNAYLEAEVVAARVSACLAVFITKMDPLQAGMAQGSGVDAKGNRYQNLEPGLVGYLGIGEDIQVVDPKRPGNTFEPFLTGLLRLIGAALNLPYELLLKDFSKTNYSSARAALLEGRRMFMTWRNWFARRFLQPIYELVLEEAFARGLFEAPDWERNKVEYCRCIWIGGGWGWIDPTKEVEASKMALDWGLSTLAEEAAAQGRDWEETLEQRAREEKKIGDLGLIIPAKGATTPTLPEPAPEKEKENAQAEER